MDKALIKEREAFRKRALAQPAVENKSKKRRTDDERNKKQRSTPRPAPQKESSLFNYKTASGNSQKFSILVKIVKHMKTRHQDGDTYPLTLEEILDETNQLDVGQKMRMWLTSEALLNNPKIEATDGGKFKFKPKYNIKDKKSLLRLLDKHNLRGWGGILQDDIEESLPHAHKHIKNLADNITKITRPDKKIVLFYNDNSCNVNVDEEFQKMWRSVSVEGVDERKIEEYLEKQGIQSMQDLGSKKVMPKLKKKGNRKTTFKKLNDHLTGVLEDYVPDLKK